jgi:methionyl-tRNA formyltransferase
MRVVYIGCVQFSFSILEHIQQNIKEINIIGVVTRRTSSFNADFASLEPLAVKQVIPIYFDQGNNQGEMAKWIRNLNPDIIYCFGWPYLLNEEILKIPRMGVVGYHPAALPKNRGRHPIIWALALGLPETASTFFFMDGGADSGDILHQELIQIKKENDAASLYTKLLEKAKQQVAAFSTQLIKGNYRRLPQEHEKANYWRKRTKKDGEIDWRMQAESVYNLVRALTTPYVGAHCVYRGEDIKIWKAEIHPGHFDINIEPGKVLESGNNMITVKCADRAIKIVDHDFSVIPQLGEYL